MLTVRLFDRTLSLSDVAVIKFCDSNLYYSYYPFPDPEDWLSIPFRSIQSFYFFPEGLDDAVF